jgi:hypothetical protein
MAATHTWPLHTYTWLPHIYMAVTHIYMAATHIHGRNTHIHGCHTYTWLLTFLACIKWSHIYMAAPFPGLYIYMAAHFPSLYIYMATHFPGLYIMILINIDTFLDTINSLFLKLRKVIFLGKFEIKIWSVQGSVQHIYTGQLKYSVMPK